MTVVTLRSSRRSRRSPRRREPEIIEAAARVFAARGFHGATTQDIADVLGIRQASLYYYFPSKEGALELVCLQGVGGFFEVAKAIASGPGTAADKLTRLIKSHLSPLTDRSDFVRVFLNERQHLPPESRRRIGKWSRGLEQVFESVLKEGVRRGEFRSDLDTRLAVLGILGMANAVANWYRAEEVAIDRISGEFARLLVAGVAKRPKPRRRAGAAHRSAETFRLQLRFSRPMPAVALHYDPARFSYMRRRLRRTTARSLAGTPAIALRSAAIARGIRRASAAAPLPVRRTTTSRLLVADRVRVTRPILDQPGDHPRERRNVDAGHGGQIDLALAVIARERGENPPHRDAQPVWRQRAAPEIDHQRRADAIDQVGKIFAEIELRAAGHEREIPERSVRASFYGRVPTMSKLPR